MKHIFYFSTICAALTMSAYYVADAATVQEIVPEIAPVTASANIVAQPDEISAKIAMQDQAAIIAPILANMRQIKYKPTTKQYCQSNAEQQEM